MKKLMYFCFVIVLCLSFLSLGFSAEDISAENPPQMSYEEYFSERKILQNSSFEYFYRSSANSRPHINSEFGSSKRRVWYFSTGLDKNVDDVDGFYKKYPEMKDVGVPAGSIYLDKTYGGKDQPILFGTGYTQCQECCGYMYTVKNNELRCWNLNTLESTVVYSCSADSEIRFTGTVLDEIVFFYVENQVYRYYRPTATLEKVFEHNRLSPYIYINANDVLGVMLYNPVYLEIMEKAELSPEDYYGFPKNPITFYTWVNSKFSTNFEIPTEEEIAKTDGKWGLGIQSLIEYNLHVRALEDPVWYNLSTGEVLDTNYCNELNKNYYPSETGENYYPDVPSPWLGTEVQGLPEDLTDEMTLVPTGAYWGEPVTEATHVYTSLGNNQARALLAALMERKNITRPDRRELLTPEAQEGKERIPASEVKAVFESLYGSGSADDMLSCDVIGDANAGDMLLKTAEGDYVYCWAPYAGSELNAEQYIKYLFHEAEGDTLNIYTAYGYYRLDDGRETYKLYGDARSLRPLEFETTTPLSLGNVGDGTLTKLRNGELDGQLTVYQHTFVKNADGSYYWASSAPFTPAPEPVTEERSPVSPGIWIGIGVLLAAAVVSAPVLYRLKKKKSS